MVFKSAPWLQRSIASLGDVQAGRQRSPYFVDGTMTCYLRVANVFDGYIDLTDVKKMYFSNKELKIYELAPGDILINEGQSIDLVGRSAIFNGYIEPCCFQNTLVRFRPGPDVINSYALQLFQFCLVSRVFASIASQTTSIAHLGVKRFANLKLPIPPLNEQKAIAAILSTWDRAIERTEALIAAKGRRKKWLMQQLLTGRVRFGEGWTFKKASDLFRNVSAKGFPEEPVLSVTQDQGVVFRDALDRKINMSQENTHTYKLVEPGDFIISLRSFQGGLEYSGIRGTVSPAYHVIRSKMVILHDFYRHYFKSVGFIGRLAVAVIGIRDGKQISYDDFSFMRLPYPPVKEQEKIARILDTADQEIHVKRKHLAALKEQKKGLMQQLLTGKVRVKVN